MYLLLLILLAVCTFARLNTINTRLSKRIDTLETALRQMAAEEKSHQEEHAETMDTAREAPPQDAILDELLLELRAEPQPAPPKAKPARPRFQKGRILFAPPALFIEAAPATAPPEPKPAQAPSPTLRTTWASQWQRFKANVDWELFAGARLFAWLGGLALFIAAGFFVKYSIDNNLIPAQLRLAIGAATGTALLIASGRVKSQRYDILRQTFASGGIGVLYSVVFAATIYYHYIPNPVGFGILSLISAAAFALSAYYRRISIAILGAVGAYITPLLLSSGQGSLILLFAYLAVVGVGLQRVSKFLTAPSLLFVAAAGTLVTSGCATFSSMGAGPALPMAVMWSAIPALFAFFLAPKELKPEENQSILWAGFLSFLPPLVAALALTVFRTGWGPLLILTAATVAALGLGLANKTWHDRVVPYIALTFLPVLAWVSMRFDAQSASVSTLLFLVYGVAGGLGPVALMLRHGYTGNTLRWLKIFPAAVVLASVLALVGTPFTGFLFWPVMLLLQVVGIGVSLLIGALLQVLLLLCLFAGAGLYWLTAMPSAVIGFGFFSFLLIAGVLLMAAMVCLLKALPAVVSRLDLPAPQGIATHFPEPEKWLVAAPSVGVFLLLGATFAVPHPHYPHGGMITLTAFLGLCLFFSIRTRFQPAAAIALVAATAAQSVWVFSQWGAPLLFSAVTWSSVLFAAALGLPFLLFREQKKWPLVWHVAALFELAQMLFVLYAAKHLWPGDLSGWLPLIPAILKTGPVAILLRKLENTPQRNSIIAFHGGVLLFYLSALPVLLLPHGWLGVALVFESALLLWLNRRIEHPGLRWVSLGLAPTGLLVLYTALPRMSAEGALPLVNPAFFSVAACTAALGAAVKLSPWPKRNLGRMDLPNTFLWMSLATGFYLVNLAIADLFSGTGTSHSIIPTGAYTHWAACALAWAGFGAITWRVSRLHIAMRLAGLFLFLSGSTGLVLLPMLLPKAIATMGPWANPAIFACLALVAMAWFTFKKESPDAFSGLTRNLLLAVLLVSGFGFLALALSTGLATGHPFTPLFSQTPHRAVASAALWILYGTVLLHWPKPLERPFRIAGLVLAGIGLIKALVFPLRFSAAFGLMIPLVNTPTLLYIGVLALLTFLTVRPRTTPWPLPKPDPGAVWSVTLAVTGFAILNIEIASLFAGSGEAFSFLTNGSLSKQLAYSIGWMLFSMGLLAVGVKTRNTKTRWAAIALLGVTSLKIFTRDLWSLGHLYRVGSFAGLAVVMILVSIIYQKFLAGEDKGDE
ncbi:DUF2339 domain-containing protein [Desulfoluna spongiiphila]|uniref:DUF2339 domain-containing protein n=1 Tax=Desulfoluna spongiiphila TaxID=419481 RepID=UPI00125AE6DB|nr:DUF2339 domain-containing protein [Desulfoluna spongiiphila]VVS90995.1 consensus disorder prediction [Desulfoluna spongiiphila]